MSSAAGSSANPRPASGAGRAYIGLGLLGWGLAILLKVAPHEDPIVGAGLATVGIALLVTSPRLPRVETLPGRLVGGLGLAAAVGVLAYGFWQETPLNPTKLAIIGLGLALAAACPFLGATVLVPFRASRRIPVATIVAYLLPTLGAPLFAYALQGAFKRLAGTTPLEVFVMAGLLVPLAAVLMLFGWAPTIAGQTITYATPRGPLAVEVGAACSGVQAMALFGAVLALFLFVERPTGRRLAFWSLVGFAGVYLANVIRLIALALVGYAWGSDALLQAHRQIGWVFFVAWALLFSLLVRRSSPPIPAAGAAQVPRVDAPMPVVTGPQRGRPLTDPEPRRLS